MFATWSHFRVTVTAALFVGVSITLRADEVARDSQATGNDEPAVEVEFVQDGRTRDIEGRVVIEARDGGILLEGEDGMLWTIEGQQIRGRKKLDSPFQPLTSTQAASTAIPAIAQAIGVPRACAVNGCVPKAA